MWWVSSSTRDEVGLLRDQHRGARVELAVFDDAGQRGVVRAAAVGLEALAQARRPGVLVDRAQLVEAAELVEGALGGREEVAHQVLQAAREQVAHAARSAGRSRASRLVTRSGSP